MSEPNAPHRKHSDDAVADDAPPTDAVTDEVRADSVESPADEGDEFPDLPAFTHP